MVEGERKFLIGIAAPTNAGKTTLVNELQERLGKDLTVVNFDDYDDYPEGSEKMIQELANPRIKNWEDPALFNYEKYLSDLAKLKSGEEVIMGSLSRENQGQGIRRISPNTYTVVEGVFVLAHSAARQLFDLKYYLDLPEEEMVRRRLARTQFHEMPWDKVDYIKGAMIEGTRAFVTPQKEFADRILDATMPAPQIAEQILVDFRQLQQRI